MRWISIFSLTVATASALLSPGTAAADPSGEGGSSIFRLGVRAVYLSPQSGGYGSIRGKVYPEIEGEWFLGLNWSTELALGAPTDFNVSDVSGVTIRLMPITWTAKYRFAPESPLRPYVGAGVNYTPSSLGGDVPNSYSTKSSSVGVVVQGGLDLKVSPTWYVTFDIRYLTLAPRAFSGSNVNPFLTSVGVAYRP